MPVPPAAAIRATSHEVAAPHRPEIDGLRALAVLVVVIFHAWPAILPSGFTGVDVFFVLSGHLITGAIWRGLEGGGFSIVAFYERRLRRILPALVVMLLAVSAFARMWLTCDDLAGFGDALTGASLGLSNLVFARQIGYFDHFAYTKPLLHTWSLGVEEQFYLVFPFLLLVLHRFARRLVVPLLILLAASSFILFVALREVEGAFYWSHLRGWELLLGSLSALLWHSERIGRVAREILCAVGVAAIIGASLVPGPGPVVTSCACLGTVAVLAGSAGGAGAVRAALAWPPLAGIGLISYSLYLWHWPLLALASYATLGAPPVLLIVGCLAAAFLLAWLSWAWIEQPARRRPFRWPRRQVFVAGGALMVLSAAIGVHLSGFAEAPPPSAARVTDQPRQLDALRHAVAIGPEDAAVVLGAAVPPDVVLWGDSHASALAYGVALEAQRHGRAIRLFGMCGVPPIVGRAVAAQTGPAHEHVERVMTFLEREAGIGTVVLAARWPGYFTESAEEPLAALLQATVDRLTRCGKRVALVYPTPEFEFDVPRTAKSLAMHGGDPAGIVLPIAGFDRRAASATAALDGIIGVALRLHPEDLLRGAGGYRSSTADGCLYRDADHLSLLGSAHVSSAFAELFEHGGDDAQVP